MTDSALARERHEDQRHGRWPMEECSDVDCREAAMRLSRERFDREVPGGSGSTPPGRQGKGAAVTEESRAAIRAAYEDGADTPEIAAAAGISVDEAETYLRWWCDRGCPGAFTGKDADDG